MNVSVAVPVLPSFAETSSTLAISAPPLQACAALARLRGLGATAAKSLRLSLLSTQSSTRAAAVVLPSAGADRPSAQLTLP